MHARMPVPALLAERSLAVALVLAAFAGLTQWIVWLNRDDPKTETYVGPPRSDYTLDRFTLTSFDERGAFAFTVEAPRLARHPWLGSFEIDGPAFRIRDAGGEDWRARSTRGHVSGDGKTLKLVDKVELDRPKSAGKAPVSIRSDELTAHVDASLVTSNSAVTIMQPGSILAGTGLDADLEQKRFSLKQRVTARYEPKPKR
ncbi:MAG TPA: LPS export ABC transporter periplasmic protein LptC [Candidatus Saccharimonadia bacterium]|nr:LPS export ABC transporter periplasmic protein LptC [Candidatus Saccharimonadia bacterium]